MAKKTTPVKVTREALKAVADDMGLKTTKKGKPMSNEDLLALVQESMDEHSDEDGKFEDETLAELAAAEEDDREIVITGDDPSVPKKTTKPAKTEKPAKKSKKPVVEEEEDDEEEEEEEEEDEKPAKGKGKKSAKAKAPAKDKKKATKPVKEAKEKTPKDRFGGMSGSGASVINKVLFKIEGKKKGLTLAQICEAVNELRDDISKDRVTAHLRRLHLVSNLIERDEKGRYTVPKPE